MDEWGMAEKMQKGTDERMMMNMMMIRRLEVALTEVGNFYVSITSPEGE